MAHSPLSAGSTADRLGARRIKPLPDPGSPILRSVWLTQRKVRYDAAPWVGCLPSNRSAELVREECREPCPKSWPGLPRTADTVIGHAELGPGCVNPFQ